MMDKVPNDLDKREGSIIHDSLAPIALELAMAYSNLDRFLEYTFAQVDTPEEFLEKRVSEIGMYRKQPTQSIKKGLFYNSENKLIDIPLNSRFSIDGINYKAIEKIDTGIYKIECEELGSIGNKPAGTLIPIDYIENLATAELGETLNEGQDIEEGESLYNRFTEKIQNPTTSGNSNHYKQWALEVNGVGKVKVFPLWNGNGTIKVVIVDSNKKAPSQDLIDKVYNHIEEVRPIGSKVTVKGAVEKSINITAKIVLSSGFNIGEVQNEFNKLLDKYLKDIAFELSYISIARIGNLLLSTPGVLDYADLKVNDSTSNVGLQDEEIPVLGTVELGV
ncbi:baseplate J/gp47 family protein [Clostridium sp. MSJ-11]|uniref:Baseplate J/gp47 family protein n=2 Tax=Clostridium mobile TaxID=2841512 RepID=A0ABS6EP83_9CLOT|nr:baseplate J/gp47 family protein [Clostridium mobile]